MENDLKPLLSADNAYIMKMKNRATELSASQSKDISQLYREGKLNDPFEDSANDLPITQISRKIEIAMR